ncbi:hypothetical protein BDZ94DRAFT_1309083 [Collybia nuda]|uniref:Uncharacterized protein n=1 Tax=Collybia nuda TaxID=64659 RepID=A0A9P5Y6L6_9AGAR|nr:hypothetical protein BDZ94DRAFT_1309083 [Collybia nuda]
MTLKRKRFVRFEPIGKNNQKGYGLPLSDLLARRGLVDPSKPIFESDVSNGKTTVTVSLQWPGYAHLPWIVDIGLVHPSGNLLTREELGHALALQVTEFIEKCETHEAFVPTDEFWRIGPGGFNMDTIRFWNLWTADEEVWYLSFHALAPIMDLSFLEPSKDEGAPQNDTTHIPSDSEDVARFIAWFTHCDDPETEDGV